ncbi:MAG TPA: hypothetical protein VLH58_07725 [Candidatus Methylomirabilis sp.]|nr:hypothetical protein [Candidatus Methylomirabilis sp.]HSC71225.1 hypothetical protein [Candidatus Methylomirabilis sp.]
MSHSLHRYGTAEQLQHDYTFYARTSRHVNREGCGPKLRTILQILLEDKQVNNFGSSHAGKSYVGGLKPDEYARTLDKAYGVAACFSEKEAIRSVLAKLKAADTGISIVVSGLIDEILNLASELDLSPHTAFLSLGIHGKNALLPEDRVLEMTTMCGHGQVATRLARAVIRRVKAGKMTPEAGARLLAQPCPCGIFNTERCAGILEAERT